MTKYTMLSAVMTLGIISSVQAQSLPSPVVREQATEFTRKYVRENELNEQTYVLVRQISIKMFREIEAVRNSTLSSGEKQQRIEGITLAYHEEIKKLHKKP
jgi:hypothetical protein